ncbi:divergent polysaccharide deacetylase family protein, partial [Salmonella enterica]|nr:divergent polysaccharide deacetylase family protein [Salmonella enterica]
KPKKPLQPVYATRFFSVIGESITQSSVVTWFQHQWQGWGKIAAPKNVSAKTD